MPGGVSRQRLVATVAKQAALDWAQAEKQFQLDEVLQVETAAEQRKTAQADAAWQQTVDLAGAKFQWSQQEHLACQAATLALATAERQRSQSLTVIEKDAAIDEATHRAALDDSFAEDEADNWLAENHHRGDKDVADVAYWMAREVHRASAATALDNAVGLPWTGYLADWAGAPVTRWNVRQAYYLLGRYCSFKTAAKLDGHADPYLVQRLGGCKAVQPLVQLLGVVGNTDRCAHGGGHVPEPPFQLAEQSFPALLDRPLFFQFVGNRSSHLENLLAMYVCPDRGFDRFLQSWLFGGSLPGRPIDVFSTRTSPIELRNLRIRAHYSLTPSFVGATYRIYNGTATWWNYLAFAPPQATAWAS